LKQDGRIPDDFITELHENEAGIDQLTGIDQQTGQPRKSKPLDLAKWLSQPKPFNQQTYLKSFGDIKRTPQQPVYTPVDGNPLKLTETINETFDKDAAQVIHARAADKYQNSFSFAEQVKAEVSDPVRRQQLADLFTQQFGTPPALPEDYATAYTMELLQPKVPKVKTVENKEAVMKQQQANALARMSQQDIYTMKHIATSWGYRIQAGLNLEQSADEAYENDKAYAATHGGEVQTNSDKIKVLFGQTSGSLRMDENGNYILEKKDTDGKVYKTETKTAEEAKESMMKYKAPIYKTPGTGAGGAQQPKNEYSQVTETNKGTIGVKNGKWYYIKTGKPVE